MDVIIGVPQKGIAVFMPVFRMEGNTGFLSRITLHFCPHFYFGLSSSFWGPCNIQNEQWEVTQVFVELPATATVGRYRVNKKMKFSSIAPPPPLKGPFEFVDRLSNNVNISCGIGCVLRLLLLKCFPGQDDHF